MTSRRKNLLFNRSQISRYLIHYLLPLLIAITVTLLSVRFVNNFIRSQNERFSNAVVIQLTQDLNDILDEAQQVSLVYSTNQYFFDQLSTILSLESIGYTQLETLRTLERNVAITKAVRMYISSIYYCPENMDNGRFLVAQDGIAYLSNHFDADFIRKACAGEADGLTLRQIKQGTSLQTYYFTYVMHSTKSITSRVAGTVIINLDTRSIQSSLKEYTRERTDDLFLITYQGDQVVFGSDELLEAGVQPADSDRVKANGTEYLMVAETKDERGFSYQIFATYASLYSSGNLLIAINLMVMFCFLLLGMVVVWHVSKDRYRDYIRAGDFIQKLDDMGSRMMGEEVYEARYEEMQNYIRLHLSENELKERTLELETLRHQLNPHLLMNTLQTLNWKLIRRQGGHTEVNVTIENLSKILSYTLYPADTLARMDEEIQYTNSYIALQSHRLPDALAMDWNIPPEANRLRIPRLIFQPIIENACKYAFADMTEPPVIRIEMIQESEGVCFIISDNGCGMKADKLLQVRHGLKTAPEGNSGIGLYNTNKRIQLLFGNRYGLDVESVPGEGTLVSIHLPRITDQ